MGQDMKATCCNACRGEESDGHHRQWTVKSGIFGEACIISTDGQSFDTVMAAIGSAPCRVMYIWS
jgi:hypothetical protein